MMRFTTVSGGVIDASVDRGTRLGARRTLEPHSAHPLEIAYNPGLRRRPALPTRTGHMEYL
jgi:hypothetical protein